jgi:hypothetical protein
MPQSLRSLPVALRPFTDECLGSWLSRTGGVYGWTVRELLSEFDSFERDTLERIDLQPACNVLKLIGVLLSMRS